jgi:protein-tyrosine phosphatase
MTSILFVCLGNICRSPIAEGTFNELVKQQGLQEQFKADSAGVMGWHTGDLPDHRTRANAEKHGIKLSHLGRKITAEDLDTFDHIIAMDKENFEALHTFYYETKKVSPTAKKLFLLRDYDPIRND